MVPALTQQRRRCEKKKKVCSFYSFYCYYSKEKITSFDECDSVSRLPTAFKYVFHFDFPTLFPPWHHSETTSSERERERERERLSLVNVDDNGR